MTFWLMRHASAAFPPGVADIDRPLSERGRSEAAAMGLRLADDPPTRIVASPARRAQETAQAVASACGLTVETDARLYPGSAQLYLDLATEGTMLVGHNPGMAQALLSLGDVPPQEGKQVPPCTVGIAGDGFRVLRPSDP